MRSPLKVIWDGREVVIKYNVETLGSEIFKRCCSGLSLDQIIRSLEEAVDIFGKNRGHLEP